MMSIIKCPVCKEQMKLIRNDRWNRETSNFDIQCYECPNCYTTAICKKGILYYYNKEGRPLMSGE